MCMHVHAYTASTHLKLLACTILPGCFPLIKAVVKAMAKRPQSLPPARMHTYTTWRLTWGWYGGGRNTASTCEVFLSILMMLQIHRKWSILLFHAGFIAVAASRTKRMLQLGILTSPLGSALIDHSTLVQNERALMRMLMGGPSMTRGGLILAEMDGLGGPLVAGDHLFRDSPTSCDNRTLLLWWLKWHWTHDS